MKNIDVYILDMRLDMIVNKVSIGIEILDQLRINLFFNGDKEIWGTSFEDSG